MWQTEKKSNSKCQTYLLSLGCSPFCLCLSVWMSVVQLPPTRHCSHKALQCQKAQLFWHWSLNLLQLIYGSGASERQTDTERKEKGQTERQCGWIGLDHLSPCLPASLPAGLWLCGVSTPPVITLYDLLHSKCYINLVTPPDYIPPALPTHTHPLSCKHRNPCPQFPPFIGSHFWFNGALMIAQ